MNCNYRFLIIRIICIILFTGRNLVSAQRVRPGHCTTHPTISTSRMCRCVHRPNISAVSFLSQVPPSYLLQTSPLNSLYIDDPHISNTICVYFGHGPDSPDSLKTEEFVMEALNENGWPVGSWEITEFRDICEPPTVIIRKSTSTTPFYNYHGCFRDSLGFEENLYTDPSRTGTTPLIANDPTLFQFYYALPAKNLGVTALLRLNVSDPAQRPNQLRFVAEAIINDEKVVSHRKKMIRMFSETYSVTYPSATEVTAAPGGTPDVELSLNYAYQVHDYRDQAICLPPPPPIPPIPEFPETSCGCFIAPRQFTLEPNPLPAKPPNPPFNHSRLGFPENVNTWEDAVGTKPPEPPGPPPFLDKKSIEMYNDAAPNEMAIEYLEYNGAHYLVIVYAFLPVYKDRLWRQREVVFSAMADNGLPIGRWVDPYSLKEPETYAEICDKMFANRSLLWTMPPFPVVGKCASYSKDTKGFPKGQRFFESGDKSNYFHFHSDYFFVNCVEGCKEPKYICAVWTYDDASSPKSTPFEIQFMAQGTFYKNEPPKDVIVPSVPTGPPPCPLAPKVVPPLRAWYVMETHLKNEGFLRRSDLWKYTKKSTKLFKFVNTPNKYTDVIMSKPYFDAGIQKQCDRCIQPATYFLEVKENNLCLCTFWKENLDTWQTHYGRQKSCINKNVKRFDEHFRIEFHQNGAPNRVVVRVFAAEPHDVEDKFVMHAVYIQAMDQHGIPVGRFDKGHWVPNVPPPVLPPPCGNDIFPTKYDPVLNRFPIFEVKKCPKRHAIPELGIPEASDLAEIFVYQNHWRDPYPEICAQFHLLGSDASIGHITTIQFIALVRIEDRGAAGHGGAYMIELRTDILDAQDLTAVVKKNMEPGGQQDPGNTQMPINYKYFRSTLVPSPYNWERDCLVPVKEPPRIFHLCRHYITKPMTLAANQISFDDEIDKYNHKCKLWVAAVQKYTGSHPYTTQLRNELDELMPVREAHRVMKKCFKLKAYKHKQLNALHVEFRVNVHLPSCYPNFKSAYLKEVALVALNEQGFPIGKSWVRGEGSFRLYNHYFAQYQNQPEYCLNDTIQLELDEKIFEERMVHDDARAKCYYDALGLYKVDTGSFMQDYQKPEDLPSMFIWANHGYTQTGFCAQWIFPDIASSSVPPERVQFVASVHICKKNCKVSESFLFTVHSPKYTFEHNQPYNVPDHLCHQEEVEIDLVDMPDDNCECDLETLTTVPTEGSPPICFQEYKDYNHILDNGLYRLCLSGEDLSKGDDDFELDDCRTKNDYEQPPDKFDNEKIVLNPGSGDPIHVDVELELENPVEAAFEACGLIKSCYSRYARDDIDGECIEGKSCDMIATFGKGLGESPRQDETVIEIFGVARAWVAIGFSSKPDDEQMGEDYVVECVKEGGKVSLYNSWNIKAFQKSKPNKTNIRMSGEQSSKHNIRAVKTIFFDDRIYCKFYIKKSFSKDDPDLGLTHHYDLGKLNTVIMAMGNELSDEYGEERGNIKTHVLNGAKSEYGRRKVAAGNQLSPRPIQARYLRIHALLMVFCWLFFVTLSTFLARYYKETLVKTRIMKQEFWYFFHVLTALLATVCMLISMALEVQAIVGWRNLFRSNFHTYSGTLCICLFVAVLVLGLWTKKRDTPDKKLINGAHSILGHVAYNLAIVNMAFSDRVAYSFLACNFATYLWIWLGVYYLLHCFMSYHYCWVDFILGRSINAKYGAVEVVTQKSVIDPRISENLHDASLHRSSLRKSRRIHDIEAQRAPEVELRAVEAPGRYIRICALVIFAIVTAVYTFWATRKLTSYPKHCYNFTQLKYLEESGFN